MCFLIINTCDAGLNNNYLILKNYWCRQQPIQITKFIQAYILKIAQINCYVLNKEYAVGVLENVKEVSELIKKYNDQDLYERIVELREQILSLREENLQIKEEISNLKKASAIEDEIIKYGNCYFKKTDEKREHPFCMTCWDVDKRLVSLHRGMHDTIKCNICMSRKT